MNGAVSIPKSIDDIETDWVNQTLAKHSKFKNTEFTSLQSERLGEGTGFISDLALLTLKDEQHNSHKIVAKIHASDSKAFDLAQLLGLYKKETLFYSTFPQQMSIRTPDIYFSHYDEASGQIALLMEYIEGSYIPDQKVGMNLEESETAVMTLADIHASFWNNDSALNQPWLPGPDSEISLLSIEFVKAMLPEYIKNFSHILSPEQLQNATQSAHHHEDYLKYIKKRPKTLTHSDYRSSNLLFSANDVRQVTVIDWQFVGRGGHVIDLSYLFANSISTGNRLEWQDHLFDIYLDRLASNGVKDYTKENFLLDFRFSLIALLNGQIMASGALNLGSPELMSFLEDNQKRIFSMIEEYNPLELLG